MHSWGEGGDNADEQGQYKMGVCGVRSGSFLAGAGGDGATFDVTLL